MRGIYAIKILFVAIALATAGTAIYWLGKAHGETSCVIQSQQDLSQLRKELAAQTERIQQEGRKRIHEIINAETFGGCVDDRIPDSVLEQLR